MRDNILLKMADWHSNYPWRILAIVIVLTLIFGALSSQLSVTMRWSDLLPSGDRRTVQFNKIVDEFTSSTSITVVVQGEQSQIKQFADVLAPRIFAAVDSSKNKRNQIEISKLQEKIAVLRNEKNREPEINKLETEITNLRSQINRPLIKRVDYKTEVDFLRDHGLMLINEKDLKNTKDVFLDPNLTGVLFNLNNSMEKEYIGDSESMSTREKEDQAFAFLDGIQNFIGVLKKSARGQNVPEEEVHAAVDKFLIGEPYLLSYDKKALILNAIPNFTMMDTEMLVTGTDVVQSIVDDVLQDFPNVTAGLTGMIPIGHDEMVYSQQSLGETTIIAVVAILVLLILSFRMWVAPVLALVNLIVGIIWAIGATAVLVGQLNIMTQMMSVILLGLGVDFSIHLISGFTEWRAAGDSIQTAMEKTFLKSGKGIITGGLTTACAFLTMIISSSRGMKEMGIVTGAGLIAILLATMLFLPVLLVFRERRLDRKLLKKRTSKSPVQRDISFRFLGKIGDFLGKHYGFTLIAAIIVTILLTWAAANITFDQNYMNIEPEGLTSITLQDTVLNKFDLSMDYALILTDDVDQSRNYAEEYRKMGSVAITEDISLYLPSPEQQSNRTPHIEDVRNAMQSAVIKKNITEDEMPLLIDQIKRLEMNVMEMQDMAFLGGQDKVDNKCKQIVGIPGKPESMNIIQDLLTIVENRTERSRKGFSKLQQKFAPYYKYSVLEMCSTAPIQLEELPESILDRYSNKTRDQFLVTVFPSGNVWQNADFLNHFVKDLEQVTEKATGMPPVFKALIEIIGRDGRNAMLLTLLIVFLLLLFDFRQAKYALLAMVPLAIGVLWMVGFMHLTAMQFTVMNVMGLPMIIGIGIDDGVHIVHRWRNEGKGRLMTIFASTGKAIFLTSLTTMLAFGSLIFSVWRGFGQLGGALFLGVAACFLTTIIFLPAIMHLIEKRNGPKPE